MGFVRQIAMFSLLAGAVLWGIGAFAFYEFLLHQAHWGSSLDNANQTLVYVPFLGVGLPLMIIGAGLLSDRWSDRFIRFVGFPASSLSGAILSAVAIVSLPILPTGYVTATSFIGEISMGPAYLRPRLNFGFNDVYFMLGLSLLLLLVGALLYGRLAKIHFSRRNFLNFVLAYALVMAGVFLILYPWTMGATLDVPILPAYCARRLSPSGCYIDWSRLEFSRPLLWPATIGGLVVLGAGFIIGSRSTAALRSRPGEFPPTIASSSQAV